MTAGIYTHRYEPTDPRLGRHVLHDPRSIAYALPVLPKAAIASQHWTRRAPIMDQGALGSCTGNAAAGWLGTDDGSRHGLTALPDGTRVDETLAVALYSAATKLDDADGTYPPTDSGSDGISVAKALQARGLCSAYQHAFSIDAVYSALQTGPGMAGTVWYESMFDTAADGHISVKSRSGVAGGHEYLVDQLEVDGSGKPARIWLTNSWGTSWGAGGRGYMTPAEFTTILADDGDFTVPTPLGATPAPVTGAPFPGALDQVAARMVAAAARAKLDMTGYQNKHWKSYFNIK